MSFNPFADVIDIDAALRTLQALLNGEETFEAAGMIRFECGHSRPTNRWIESGATGRCFFCGRQTVDRLDLIPATVFPTPDSIADLPVVA